MTDPAALAVFLRQSPYHRWLGLELVRAAPGEVTVRMPFREEFVADDGPVPYIHGGVIASLADAAADFAVIAAVGRDALTIDLRIDYLRPAGPGALVATARAVRVGRSTAVADVEVQDDAGAAVAIGRGVFRPITTAAPASE